MLAVQVTECCDSGAASASGVHSAHHALRITLVSRLQEAAAAAAEGAEGGKQQQQQQNGADAPAAAAANGTG